MSGAAKALKYARFFLGFGLLLLWTFPGGLLALAGARVFAVRTWCCLGLFALGVRVKVKGQVPGPGTLVAANHVSYIDIFALGAVAPGAFVAKSEIRGWPLLGAAARMAGVLFVDRDNARKAFATVDEAAKRLEAGERVLLFPEGGIVGNGEEPAPFHPMFFGAALEAEAPVAAAALCYIEPADRTVWAWLEGEHPAHHLRHNLLPADYVKMTLVFGDPIPPARFPGRKELAAGAQEEVSRLWRDEKNSKRPAA